MLDDSTASALEEVKSDDYEFAFGVANVEYEGKPDRPPDAPTPTGWPAFGQLVPLSKNERRQLDSMQALVTRFVAEPIKTRPLCFAVFGPPGSGKSFAVKQIKGEVEQAGVELEMATINLTQVTTASELASAIAAAMLSAPSHRVPLLFFDEFDAPREGAPYGWLSWFLAPMHDAEFLHGARSIPVARAVFAFAGGTASSIREFSDRRNDRTFRDAKGPDFISRLRGYLDVAGPNSEPTMLRRAYVLRAELQKRVDRLGRGKRMTVDATLLEAFLRVGRYRHGARSITALVELCEPRQTGEGAYLLDRDALPDNHLVDLLVDRGPLDPSAIAGAIALSGFGTPVAAHDTAVTDRADKQQHRRQQRRNQSTVAPYSIEDCWKAVASTLWNNGATLAYAGRWDMAGHELAQLLVRELQQRPPELCRTADAVRDRPPRFRSYLRGFDYEGAKKQVEKVLPKDRWGELGIELEEPHTLADDEFALGKDEWKARVIEIFRRRLATTEASVARFVVGGDLARDGDRPSGIVEETMLSLAFGQPIYVAGGFGGAAQQLGHVLGLSELRTGALPESLNFDPSEENARTLNEIAPRLQPPPLCDLPVLPKQRVAFLRRHALGGERWPYNGLTADENRELFECGVPKDVADLVVMGLLRRFEEGLSVSPRAHAPRGNAP